jgi:autotransporter-associated beta strand protein
VNLTKIGAGTLQLTGNGTLTGGVTVSADFYTDDGVILWTSLRGYRQMVKHLGFAQEFLRADTIAALAEVHLGARLPAVLEGSCARPRDSWGRISGRSVYR